MAWENTLLASRILPPSYSPVDLVNNNRTQESTLSLEGDGRVTLLVILTTAAGLAVVLLLFILLRIGCLRGKICFSRYKGRHHRSPNCLLPSSAGTMAAEDLSTKPSTGVGGVGGGTGQHIVQARSEQDPTSNYTIKLIDNELIIETQQDSSATECGDGICATILPEQKPQSDSTTNKKDVADESGFQLFKSWLLMMKMSKEDSQNSSQQPLETKSLASSPVRYPIRGYDRGEVLANQRQQILDRFYNLHPPTTSAGGFGFNRSQSLEADHYTYSHGNQVEYLGGQYGCIEPAYPIHIETTGPSNSTPSSVSNFTSHPTVRSAALLMPTLVRSAESLVVLSREQRRPPIYLDKSSHKV